MSKCMLPFQVRSGRYAQLVDDRLIGAKGGGELCVSHDFNLWLYAFREDGGAGEPLNTARDTVPLRTFWDLFAPRT
jgi:hypothetical protein